MTYRERVAIEYPSQINPYCEGGVVGCPGNYWDGAPLIQPDCFVTNEVCAACWDRQAQPRKVKVRNKRGEGKNGDWA